MLRQVAYQMQATEKGLTANLIAANELERILTDYLKTIEISQARTVARLIINQLRTRNFILCFLGADYYAFVHPSIFFGLHKNRIKSFHYNHNVSIILNTIAQIEDRRINIQKWLQRLASHRNITDMKNDFQELRKEIREMESGNFSTLRTKITNAECLKETLRSLGFNVKNECDVYASYGMRVRENIVAVLEGNYDIGWSLNSNGTFDSIVDLWGVAKKYNHTELVGSINQRYAVMSQGYKRFIN